MCKKLSKRNRIIATVIPTVIIMGLLIGSFVFLTQSSKPMQEALDALESDLEVDVIVGDDWIVFSPKSVNATIGVILYPGGNVDHIAYAVLAKGLAVEGYLVSIIRMPFDLAFFSPKKGGAFIQTQPNITSWIIGGHSLGGSMATSYVHDSPNLFDGIFYLAAYPAKSDSLAGFNISAISIYGSLDGVLSNEISDKAAYLPSSTTYFEIVGGNHANFGYYGDQKGDNTATITREQQHAITITQLSLFILNL